MAFNFFKKTPKKDPAPNAGPHYYDLKVRDIIRETRDAITIVLEQPVNKLNYKAGQFLTLIAPVGGKEIRRAYSMCSSPFTDQDLAVTVKRVDNGAMSNWLNDHLQVGRPLR